jgi:uncharacterized protein
MPWSISDVDRFNKGLSDKEKAQWVAVANSVYESCIKDGGTDNICAVSAIKQANGVVAKRDDESVSNIETRTVSAEVADVRAIGDTTTSNRTVAGYGIVFNSESAELEGEDKYGMKVRFHEVILPSAIEGVVERSDILALMNHDMNRGILARSTNGQGTLRIIPTANGVRYSFEAPNFPLGDELIEGIKRGDIRTSSFAFSTPKDMSGEKWQRRNDGTYLRTVSQFDKIFDMSPCYREAYQDTTVALRSLDEFKNTNKDLNEVETKLIIADPIIEPIVETSKRSLSEDELNLKRTHYKLKYNIRG